MKMLARAALGLSAFLACVPAPAQSPHVGKTIEAPTTRMPSTAIYCDDGSGKVALCSLGGGGGGGTGDASAANQTTQITRATEIRDRIGSLTLPAAGSTNALLASILAGHPVTQSGTWSFNLGSGGLGSSGSPIFTQSATATAAAVGAPAPTNAQQIAGRDPAGNTRAPAVDTRGGLAPAQGISADTRTTLTASTATSIAAAAPARIGLTVQVEAALTADLFLCASQANACSATNYTAKIPSGATAGTTYAFLFAPPAALFAFSTGTPAVVTNSWVAP